MKYRFSLILIIIQLATCFPLLAQWQVEGGLYDTFSLEVAPSTGLSAVYLVYGTRQLSISYQLSSDAPAKAYTYSQSALNPTPIKFQQTNSTLSIIDPQVGLGYVIEQEGRSPVYMWVIDYEANSLQINSLSVNPELSNCYSLALTFDRVAPELFYHTINGQRKDIERLYTLSYNTLQWDEENKIFVDVELSEEVKGYKDITIDAPLTDTEFTIVGDQFLAHWGIADKATSENYTAIAVDGRATAEHILRESGNELDKQFGTTIGGSAPVDVEFRSYVNENVVSYVAWEFSRDREFEVIDATYTDADLSYSFEEEGNTYVRCVVNNSQGSCEKVIETFEITTVESMLKVPNVFTPQSRSGNNQMFKVAYKSIIDFEAIVYNVWGNELYRWTDPSKGWDGKYKGKYVPTGAYYYFIKAEGVGGKKYELKGDINVLNSIE